MHHVSLGCRIKKKLTKIEKIYTLTKYHVTIIENCESRKLTKYTQKPINTFSINIKKKQSKKIKKKT